MKKEIKNSEFARYFLYTNEGVTILTQKWSSNTETMDDDGYKREMLVYLEIMQARRIEYVLINVKDFRFVISNSLQEWVDKNINLPCKEIVQKIAFLMPPGLIERLSIELTMEEEEASTFDGYKYFEDEDEAMQWLR